MKTEKHLAIVDDSDDDIERLTKHLHRYMQEEQVSIDYTVFKNGMDFLESYRPVYDVVMLDIEMPHLSGMETAKKLRDIDPHVPLIFVTRMAQYAVDGYEVSALDFIVKPLRYGTLIEKLESAFRRIERQSASGSYIFLEIGADSYRKVRFDDIYYVTKHQNYIIYVTKDGEFRVRGTLKTAEDTFARSSIVKCAKGVLVNLHYVEKKVRSTISIQGVQFTVTKPYMESFTEAFMQFLRGEM